MKAEVYFSVDIEADGPIPGPYSMSSFGAVACAYRNDDGEVRLLDVNDSLNQFYAELKPITDDFVPEAAAVSGLDRDELIANGSDPQEAMSRFEKYAIAVTLAHSGQANAKSVFVGWPLPYDWMWLYWYLIEFNGSSPFSFSSAFDMNTWYAAKTGTLRRNISKREVYKQLGVKALPHTHNALDDAVEQGVLWQNLLVNL